MKTKNLKVKTKKISYLLLALIFTSYFLLSAAPTALAGPTSTSYELKEYGFGTGGVASASSSTYSLDAITGEISFDKLTSSSYGLGPGLIFTLKANVPAAPAFTNPSANYDRLKVVIDNGSNPSDTLFAIAISSDNFASDKRFIQSDYTMGANSGSEVYLDYSTGWNGSTGFYVTGLRSNTTYYIKVKARQGNFTESEYSSVVSTTTSDPSLTFSLDSNSVTFSNLNGGNSYTDSSKTSVLTTSTNAYGGYTVYAKETQALTSPNGTIANYVSPNSTPTSWSGTGFGYTTSDNNLGGTGGATRFSSGTKYAGFVTSSFGDPVADHASGVLTQISGEAFTVTYRVTGDNLTKAGTYSNVILYTVTPTF